MSTAIATGTTKVIPLSMATIKSSFSMDEELYQRLELLSKTSGESISALIAEGVEWVVTRRDGLAAVAEWEAENGEFTPEELAEADRKIEELLGKK